MHYRVATNVVQYIALHSGVDEPLLGDRVDQTKYEFESSWTPTELCADDDPRCSNFYHIRSIAISDLESPELLSPVLFINAEVK